MSEKEEKEQTSKELSSVVEQKEENRVEEKTTQTQQKKVTKVELKKKTPTSQIGVKEGWVRNTTLIKKDHLKKLKALAYLKDKPVKDILDEAISQYLKDKKISPVLLKRGVELEEGTE